MYSRRDFINNKYNYYHDDLLFLPIDVEDFIVNDIYILHLHGILDNGEKIIVNIHNLQVFVDVYLRENKIYKNIVLKLFWEFISKV
jgi:hypothetical protein